MMSKLHTPYHTHSPHPTPTPLPIHSPHPKHTTHTPIHAPPTGRIVSNRTKRLYV